MVYYVLDHRFYSPVLVLTVFYDLSDECLYLLFHSVPVPPREVGCRNGGPSPVVVEEDPVGGWTKESPGDRGERGGVDLADLDLGHFVNDLLATFSDAVVESLAGGEMVRLLRRRYASTPDPPSPPPTVREVPHSRLPRPPEVCLSRTVVCRLGRVLTGYQPPCLKISNFARRSSPGKHNVVSFPPPLRIPRVPNRLDSTRKPCPSPGVMGLDSVEDPRTGYPGPGTIRT